MSEHYPWHDGPWQYWLTQYQQRRVPHAMLLTGPKGVAKNVFAEQMVAVLLCEQQDGIACGHCQNCQLLAAGNHPDHTVITPEEQGQVIKVDHIRQLKDKQALTAHVAKSKTVIITPAEAMNRNAYNSLLKLLEEPQQNSFLILLTQDRAALPITITSRCQQVTILPPQQAVATQWIKTQVNQAEDSAILEALFLAKGAPILALQYLQEDTITDLHRIKQDFAKVVTGNADPVDLAQQWQQYDLTLLFHYLQKLIQQRIETAKAKVRPSSHYWHIYDCIINAIKLLSSSSNINKVLLIEQFMMTVMQKTTIK